MLRPGMGSITPPSDFRSSTPAVRPIGRYLLCDVIASGGMATVHLGRLVGDEGFSRTVAIKQLYQHFARSQEFVTMFLDEARILSRIRHPHVVAPLDVIVLEGELFIVMEYVHGASLAELLDASGGPIPPRIASAIVVQTLLGLHAAHEATSESGEPLSIVHRDISPHNVLVGGDGIARVVDFGIAKAESRARTTGDGSLKGKLGYMAPEQLRSRPVDRRTDLFTCGIVLWEALTGQRLYAADNIGALFHKLETTTIRPPSELVANLPRELDNVVRRALALEPAERVPTAREMAMELERAVAPASTLEISEWVDGLVGPLLRARAEQIAELESVHISDLTLARVPSNPPARGPATAPPAAPVTVTAVAMAMPVTLAAAGVGVTAAIPRSPEPKASSAASPRPDARPELALAATEIAAAHFPLSAESTTSTPRAKGRLARAPLVAVPLVLFVVGAGYLWDRAARPPASGSPVQAAAPERSALPSKATLESPAAAGTTAGASTLASAASPANNPPVPSPSPAPVLEPPRALSAQEPSARSASAPSARAASAPRTAKPTAAARSTETRPSPVVAPPTAMSPAAPAAATRAGAAQHKCSVPYFVDEHGVKRFKPECF